MSETNPSAYARDTRALLDTHIETVNLKLESLGDKIDDQKKTMRWAAGLIVSIMLSVMAWALMQQYNANEAQKADLQQQIVLLRQQEDARKSSTEAPQVQQPQPIGSPTR